MDSVLTVRKEVATIGDCPRVDSDYVFHELTRSICPICRRVIDAKILLRDNQVFMSKRCPQCGPFMALVYADAKAYIAHSQYNKPGTIPLAYGSNAERGCPHDCGLCPDHEQHACLASLKSTAHAIWIARSVLPTPAPDSA